VDALWSNAYDRNLDYFQKMDGRYHVTLNRDDQAGYRLGTIDTNYVTINRDDQAGIRPVTMETNSQASVGRRHVTINRDD